MARVVRHESERDRWEMVFGAPDPRLDGYVLSYCAYDERTGSFVRRRELPSDRVVAIVNLGAPIRVRTAEGWAEHPDGFLAGLDDTYALTETTGAQRGVQIDLSAVGAHLLLRMPMHELTGRVVTLEALFGRAGAAAARGARRRPPAGRRASSCSTRSSWSGWTTRSRRCRASRARSAGCARAAAACAWRRWRPRSAAAAGTWPPASASRSGVSPKLLGRILRFQRAVALAGDRPRLGRDRPALRLLRPGAPDPRLQPVRGQLAGRVRAPPAARRRRRCRRLTRCSETRRASRRGCDALVRARRGRPRRARGGRGRGRARQDAPAAPRRRARRRGGHERAAAPPGSELEHEFAFGAVRQLLEAHARSRAPRRWRRRRSGCPSDVASRGPLLGALRALLAGREPRRGAAAAAVHRRRAVGRRAQPALPGVPRPAAGGAAGRARGRHSPALPGEDRAVLEAIATTATDVLGAGAPERGRRRGARGAAPGRRARAGVRRRPAGASPAATPCSSKSCWPSWPRAEGARTRRAPARSSGSARTRSGPAWRSGSRRPAPTRVCSPRPSASAGASRGGSPRSVPTPGRWPWRSRCSATACELARRRGARGPGARSGGARRAAELGGRRPVDGRPLQPSAIRSSAPRSASRYPVAELRTRPRTRRAVARRARRPPGVLAIHLLAAPAAGRPLGRRDARDGGARGARPGRSRARRRLLAARARRAAAAGAAPRAVARARAAPRPPPASRARPTAARGLGGGGRARGRARAGLDALRAGALA